NPSHVIYILTSQGWKRNASWTRGCRPRQVRRTHRRNYGKETEDRCSRYTQGLDLGLRTAPSIYFVPRQDEPHMDLSREKLLWIYRHMRLIREFENQLHADFAAGKIPGFVHLYAGEEAVAVGVCAQLDQADFITSTHRGHGHCIAKGVPVQAMMAEIH